MRLILYERHWDKLLATDAARQIMAVASELNDN